MNASANDVGPVSRSVIAEHAPDSEESYLIARLTEIQERYHYLPHSALVLLSETLNIPLAQIYAVATFYNAFSLKPRGAHLIRVCMGTACHVRGAPLIGAAAAYGMGLAMAADPSLPMATPALGALTILTFQGMWNEFFKAAVVLSGQQANYTLPLGLSFFRSAYGVAGDWGLMLASAFLSMIPIIILFVVFQRYFVEGVSTSALKG